jgi:hypothetical protein
VNKNYIFSERLHSSEILHQYQQALYGKQDAYPTIRISSCGMGVPPVGENGAIKPSDYNRHWAKEIPSTNPIKGWKTVN